MDAGAADLPVRVRHAARRSVRIRPNMTSSAGMCLDGRPDHSRRAVSLPVASIALDTLSNKRFCYLALAGRSVKQHDAVEVFVSGRE